MDSNRDDTLTLHFTLPTGDVSFPKLIKAQQTFLEIAREVAKSLLNSKVDPFAFKVIAAREGSLELLTTPMPIGSRATLDDARRTVAAVSGGIATLQQGPTRPHGFNDRALERAEELARLLDDQDLPRMRVNNGTGGTDVTKVLALNVKAILDRSTTVAWGTVEGRMEGLTIHGQRSFNIYDLLTHERTECHFGQRVRLQEVLDAMEKRVRVTGTIRYRDTGEIASLSAEQLAVMPPDEALPTARDVLGILRSPS